MDQSADQKLTPQDTPFAQDYRPDVDGLRAVAVLAVIVHHFSNALLPGGFLGVDMFFVISGYVITASLAKQPHKNTTAHFLGFYSRRIKRLLPALILCVVATGLVGALFINPLASEFSASMEAGLYSLLGASNIYFFRTATDYFGSSAQLNLFTHTWSLGVEEQFYIVFPALFWISGYASGRPRGRLFLLAALGLLTILSFSLYIWFNTGRADGAYFLMPPRFWELSVGCVIALAIPAPGERRDYAPAFDVLRSEHAPWLAAALLAIALLAPIERQLYATPAVVIGAAALIVTLRPDHPLYRLLTLRGVLMVGLMSYSLYLWHWSVLSISRWTIGVHWWSAPIQVAAMLGLAASSYAFVERPLRRAEWSASRLATIGFGLFAVGCAASVFLVLKSGLNGMLYTGSPAHLEAKGVETLMNDKFHAGKLQWPAHACILSSDQEVGKQIDADACTFGEPSPSKPHFLVIGNSFSASEFEMYAALSESGLGSVTLTSSWGASPVPETPNSTPWAKANAYYWSSVVPALISRLKDGDVLLMINDTAAYAPPAMNTETEEGLAILRTGLTRLAAELRKIGVQIIFQSSNPFMREAQCTPDMAKLQWFNLGDRTGCAYYTRASSLERRQPLQQTLEQVRSANPNFHILDLFPALCAEDVCRFYNNQGVFLYRDAWSHPSVEANYLARPIFLAVVNEAIKASKTIVQSAKNPE